MLNNTSLDQMVIEQIRVAVDSAVQSLVNQTIDNLILDQIWLEKIQILVNQHMSDRILQQLSMVDINSVVVGAVKENFNQWKKELEQSVSSPGIVDNATTAQLTVMDGVVVVEEDTVTKNLAVEQSAEVKGDLTVNNFIVKGTINTDNNSWDELSDIVSKKVLERATAAWHESLTKSVLEYASTTGIDFASVTVNGETLISGNMLSSEVTHTSITRLGILDELKVNGPVQFTGGTLNTLKRRVGINTADPEMALSVWDEEVSLLMGRLKEQHGYIGTARNQSLSIGVNRKAQIELDADGLTTIKQLRVGQHRISFGREVPGYSGTRGDIVFNQDPKPDAAFAWQCLGGFKWNPIGLKQ
jgi:hypothetical protein